MIHNFDKDGQRALATVIVACAVALFLFGLLMAGAASLVLA